MFLGLLPLNFVAQEGGAEQPAVHNHLPSELNEQCSVAIRRRRGQAADVFLPLSS